MKHAFNSITSELIAIRKSVHEVCRQFSRSPSKGNLKRVKALFQTCGEDVIIEAGVHLDYGNNISLGERVYININCTFIDSANPIDIKELASNSNLNIPKATKNTLGKYSTSTGIVIGDDCLIGPNVQFLAISHDVDPKQRKAHKLNFAEGITLHNNVWLGAGVIVLAGITIGENSVVGAGSVITKSIEANSFYAGNPAVKIRDI